MRNAATSAGLFSLLLVACQGATTLTPTLAPTLAPAQRADPARLAADVAWLADDAREGRRAGTEQGLAAGRWIAERMRALGLEPAGENGGYEQEFQVQTEPRTGGDSYLSAGGDRASAQAGEVAPLFCSERGLYRGPAVWCGYGIELADRGWDDFAGRDLQKAVVFVLRGSPKSPPAAAAPAQAHGGAPPADNPHGDVKLVAPGDPFAHAGLVFTKVMNAKRRGAAAVVLVQHPDDAGQPILAFHEGGSGRAGIPCATISWNAAQRLFDSGPWDGRAESAPAGRDDDPLGVVGRTVTIATDVVREKGPATNVLGLVPGRDRSRVVVVGAHYDHLGHGGTGSLAPGKREIHNGADDNASGTAAVLEVARLLRAGPPPACDVLIALWSGEELGLLGSEHWAQHPTVPFERVVANVNLDMVGRAGNGKLQILGAGSAREFAGWLAEAGPRAGLELTVNASASAMSGSSDHATFAKRKKPVLHLFSGLHSDYHKPSDDIERFESGGAARTADLTLDLVDRLSRARGLAFVEPAAPEGEKRQIQSGFNAWFGSIPNYAFEGPGVKIDGTSPGSPAEHAGFLAGDVLLQLGEVKLANIYDFTYSLQHYKPGDVVLVRFERDGQMEETRVTLSSRGLR